MFRVDAAVRPTIVRAASGPHFESLQLIDSAGAWDKSGDRFVFAALSAGHPLLLFLNMRTGRLEREAPLRDVDRVFSPSWSPRRGRGAFSALKGGLSDLYVLDLDAGVVRALTADSFTDIQPA